MKILITGASGYLGKRLLTQLSNENNLDIIVIGNTAPDSETEFTFIKANLLDKDSLYEVAVTIGNIDSIVHLAARVPKSGTEDEMQSMVATNIVGTSNLLASFNGRFEKLIFGSTAEVYGVPTIRTSIDEKLLPEPKSYYGITKLASEILANAFCEKNNITFISLRFSVMYGVGDLIKRAIPNFIEQAINDQPISVFGGEELRDYLHIDDASNSIVISLSSDISGIYNIGTGIGISILDTAKEIIKTCGSKSEIDILPRRKPAADIVLDCQSASGSLGFKAQYIFPAGIEEQIKWHKNR